MATTRTTTNGKTPTMPTTKKTDPSDDIAALREDLKTIREDVGSLFTTLSQSAQVKASKGVDKGKEAAEKANETLKDTRGYVEDQVRANPLASVGIALGAGFLLAALRRK